LVTLEDNLQILRR